MKRWIAVGALALAACGGAKNGLDGDLAFDVKRARAVRFSQAGHSLVEVMFSDIDFTCDQLKGLGSGTGSAFVGTNVLFMDYADEGVATYTVVGPGATFDGGAPPTALASLALLELSKQVDVIATSGTLNVTSSDTGHVAGKFDTQAADLRALSAAGTGHVDAQGNVTLPDGGTVSGRAVSGEFDVDVCP